MKIFLSWCTNLIIKLICEHVINKCCHFRQCNTFKVIDSDITKDKYCNSEYENKKLQLEKSNLQKRNDYLKKENNTVKMSNKFLKNENKILKGKMEKLRKTIRQQEKLHEFLKLWTFCYLLIYLLKLYFILVLFI